MDDEKLLKVLALAASKHDGEALSALRAAQIILARHGMTLQDLVRGAPERRSVDKPPAPPPPPPAAPDQTPMIATLRRQTTELRQSVEELSRRLQQQVVETDRQRHEAAHWRGLARDTADRLWDLGKALESQSRSDSDGQAQRPPRTRAERLQALLARLGDPACAAWSDRELSRRTGVPVASIRRLRKVLGAPGQPTGRPARPSWQSPAEGRRVARRRRRPAPHGTSR